MESSNKKEWIYKRIFIALWIAFGTGVLTAAFLFIYVAQTKMPDTEELENPRFEESSIVFSSDMVEIDRYFSTNRQWVRYSELSPHLVDALVATEDHRFFSHSGIDARGTARAFAFLGRRGGASTITQQLAKQFFTPVRSKNPARRIWQKMKEWVIAVEFERRYTKEEIIAMFLNKFDFIYNANGVAAAANVYFGKDQRMLEVHEAAMLIGMLKNPYLYNPKRQPEIATRRRNIVLSQMMKNDFLNDEDYEELRIKELDMSNFKRGDNYNGLAPYFMSELKKYTKDLLAKEGITKPGGEKYNLDSDGLKIFSTIDTRYQIHAEAAMKEHMASLQEVFFRHWSGRDPWEYDINASKRIIRQSRLRRLVEETELYQSIRRKTLGSIISEVSAVNGETRMWDIDIRRMLNADSDPNHLDQLLEDGMISVDQKNAYEGIMTAPTWGKLKNQWEQFQLNVEREFKREKEVKVYTHNGLESKTMSSMDSIKYMSMLLQLGSLSMDPRTGHVKSWVGGIDYDYWKYDHVTSSRQVGSTFKPFLYTIALMSGYSPCFPVDDIQYTIPAREDNFGLMESWSPKNSRGEFSGEPVTLRDGLRLSLNSVSTWLVKELGTVKGIVQLAGRLGLDAEKIPEYPSIVLGTPDVSVLEMTTAYSVFANDGIKTDPIFIDRIENRSGEVIYQSRASQSEVIRSNINYVMVDMLKYASSSVAWQLESEFGGKTGTTDDHVDGWYMGITPELVTGTWVGGDLPWIRFRTIDLGQGGVLARPFFLNYMKRLETDTSIQLDTEASFAFPEDLGIELDCERYEELRNKRLVEDEFDDIFEQ